MNIYYIYIYYIYIYRAFQNIIRDYKNFYRKTVGHVFTKPVQIEGTTQSTPKVSCFSS